ncbi:MAG: DUF3311 domain-containing protein [Candidatus Micrarchaeaceae archaeon]
MKARYVLAAILLLIPLAVYCDVWFFNVVEPSWGGLPFYYWFQILMLLVSGILFYFAVYLIDKK